MELIDVGWKPFFQQQLSQLETLEEFASQPVRVIEVQRSGLTVAPALAGIAEIPMAGRWFLLPADERPTVGDWVLVDPDTGSIEHLFERTSVIKRLAPSGEIQLIAANIDTAFLVTSCNDDFSLPRLERYLAAVLEADIQPVVVLTKADLVAEREEFVDAVRSLGSDLIVECINALAPEEVAGLSGWCDSGQSIALLGSSGVGKSTLVNTLCGRSVQLTSEVREADAKGRHTTTHRSLHGLPQGGVILDSPGMREFQIADAEAGVDQVFEDIAELALTCRFNDCQHASEPGCAIRDAIESGELEPRRLASYNKLQREETFNTKTIAERHARVRQFSKMVKQHTSSKPRFKR